MLNFEEKFGVLPTALLKKSNYTTPEIAEERMEICLECPFLIQATKTCKKCGCFMSAKTKLKKAKCPINKW